MKVGLQAAREQMGVKHVYENGNGAWNFIIEFSMMTKNLDQARLMRGSWLDCSIVLMLNMQA